MGKRLIGIVALGAATLFLGAVPAHADDPVASTTVLTAATYVEWSTTSAEPMMVLSGYVEW
jgi:hypothetical protein